MGKYGFEHGTYFMVNHIEYVVRKSDIRDVVVENIPYKKIETWSRKELTSLWEKGELVFRIKNSENGDQGERRIQADFDMLPDEYKKEALRRYEILKPVIKGEIPSKGIVNYLESLPEHLRVSRATFYLWKKIWETYEDIRYLVPQYEARGPKKLYTNPVVLKIMDEVINDYVYRGEKYTDRVMYAEFLLRIDEHNEFRENDDKLNPVSKSTFVRRKKVITDQHKKNKLKYGKPKADLMKNGSTTELYATRPLERVEIDWTQIDVLLVDPDTLQAKKPFLIYAIDKFSGYPLGFFVSFHEPDVIALKQCLLHCLMPKTYIKEYYPLVQNEWIAYGKPEYIVLDNAQVNNSRDLEDVCRELDIDILYCAVGSGHQKGTIERAFRSLNEAFIHLLKGTTFSNTLERA
jgi:putative transposase